jgi:hypothetical protein
MSLVRGGSEAAGGDMPGARVPPGNLPANHQLAFTLRHQPQGSNNTISPLRRYPTMAGLAAATHVYLHGRDHRQVLIIRIIIIMIIITIIIIVNMLMPAPVIVLHI